MEEKDLGNTSIGMKPNMAAALSYLLGFLTGVVFYVLEKENKFVRFHAMQSIVVFGALFVVGLVIGVLPGLNVILLPLLWIGELVLWIVLMANAYQGRKLKLPLAGDLAEKNA